MIFRTEQLSAFFNQNHTLDKKMIRFIPALLLTYVTVVQSVTQVPVGLLSLQIQSSSDSETSEVLNEVRKLTHDHLNNYFAEYFTPEVHEDFFARVEMNVIGYEKFETYTANGVIRDHIAQVSFDGFATFNEIPVPRESFLDTLVGDAFLGISRSTFLNALKASDNAMISSIMYLAVKVDENVISDEIIEDTSDSETGIDLFGWNIALPLLIGICIIVGAFGLMIIGMTFYCYDSSCFARYGIFRQKQDRDSNDDGAPVKRGKPRGRFRNKEDPDLELASTRSPSPIRSLASQDSSKFTYNPRSKGSQDYNPKSTESPSVDTASFKKLNVNTRTIDVAAWQKSALVSGVTPATGPTFGQDISSIEVIADGFSPEKNRDLSFIQEADDEDESPMTKLPAAYQQSCRKNEAKRKSQTKKQSRHSYGDPNSSDSTTSRSNNHSVVSDGSDVINDLKNLSVQINKHRSLPTSKREKPSY